MKHLLISGGMAFASRRMLLAILLCCSFARGYDYNFFTRCPPGWSTASGTTCFKAFCDQKSWFDAQVACKASNGVLARVSSPKDSQLVRYLMQGAQSFWIGCNSRERKEGEFVWAGYGGSACIGPFASYTNWHQGQPDNIGREMQSIGHAEQCVNVGKMTRTPSGTTQSAAPCYHMCAVLTYTTYTAAATATGARSWQRGLSASESRNSLARKTTLQSSAL